MEEPPSPDYIPEPEAPPSLDYILGPEYPEYLLPADDVFPAKEQPLPAAVLPTAELPGYIMDSEPEMDPEEDGDNEKSEGDSIDYPTNKGDDDADDDDDDLSEDDADEEDEEESSDKPFEEGETTATPPPSVYRVTARISVRPHIPMPFPLKSEVDRLLAIPTPPLSLVLPTSYPLPPFLMPLPIFTPLPPPPPIILPHTRASMVLMRSVIPSTFILAPLSRTPPIGTPPLLPIPLPTSSFPLPLLLPSTSCREEALAEYETQRNSVVNGDTSHTTGTGPRTVRPTHECTYQDYLNYGPLKFNGTEGVIVSQEVAYAMPWKTLRQMMTANYTLRFQELALLCRRMFPEESDEIERYVSELPEMIQGNVMSYEPKSMQKAIEFANDQMDQKLLRIVNRQADNKRKFDNTSRNQQNQQPFRRNNNVAWAYAAGSGEKKPYGGTKPLCPKCNFHHDGPCGPKCINCKRTGHIA
uniref:Reverse transcriptase domain-containing protein n=1 Tax=Tanacetum cinerariifolium TaxID=118510 RepID=A0A6L2KJ83_TANCI|nr:hypothetical protein [Tanacetum cinerariifolium]